jgi:hypothetical protein
MFAAFQVVSAAGQAAQLAPAIVEGRKEQLLPRRLLATAYVHTAVPTGKDGTSDTSSMDSEDSAANAIGNAEDDMAGSTDDAMAAQEAAANPSMWQSDQGNRKLLNIPALPRPSIG